MLEREPSWAELLKKTPRRAFAGARTLSAGREKVTESAAAAASSSSSLSDVCWRRRVWRRLRSTAAFLKASEMARDCERLFWHSGAGWVRLKKSSVGGVCVAASRNGGLVLLFHRPQDRSEPPPPTAIPSRGVGRKARPEREKKRGSRSGNLRAWEGGGSTLSPLVRTGGGEHVERAPPMWREAPLLPTPALQGSDEPPALVAMWREKSSRLRTPSPSLSPPPSCCLIDSPVDLAWSACRR